MQKRKTFRHWQPEQTTLLLLYACYEDLAFLVLTGNQQPDHSRISEFRRRNLDALKDLFVQILRLCQKEINALIHKAEILDAQEDRRYGKGKLGSELPDELRHKQGRLEKIRQARKEMEEEIEQARAKATSAEEPNASTTEQGELNRKAEAAAAKAKAARE